MWKNKTLIKIADTSFNNYSFEFTPTGTCAGSNLLYIANHLSYKCRNNLNIYKKNELESFIGIFNPKKSDIIVRVIYRHPSMDLTDFNYNYLKLVSAIFYQIFIFRQMIDPQKLWKMFFISSKKPFSFLRYSNFCIIVFPSFFPCQPLLKRLIQEKS